MPDKQPITIGNQQFRCTEPLFRPPLAGIESPGIPGLLVESVSQCDLDIRPKLYEAIVLSRCSAVFLGLEDRLLENVRTDPRVHMGADVKMVEPHIGTMSDLVFLGASKTSLLEPFASESSELWYTQHDWQNSISLFGNGESGIIKEKESMKPLV